MYTFSVRVVSDADTADAAYNEIRQALQYCGLDIRITPYWRKDGVFMSTERVLSTAASWEATHDELTIDPRSGV